MQDQINIRDMMAPMCVMAVMMIRSQRSYKPKFVNL